MNTNKNISEIIELSQQGRWDDILTKYLNRVQDLRPTNNPPKHKENYEILSNVLVACMNCGSYCDYIDVLKRYYQLSHTSFFKYPPLDLKDIANFTLESLLYCLYNNKSENLGIKFNILEHIDNLLIFQNKLDYETGTSQDQRKNELVALYDDYKNGKMPIYVVEYSYPFEPLMEDYVFDLSPCPPYISLEVKKKPRDIDSHTHFRFKIKGLIKPDTLWQGARWKDRVRMPPIKKTLAIVNMLLLNIVKASPGKMVTPYNIEQVTSASMLQYRYNEKDTILGGTLLFSDFRATFIGSNAKWNKLTQEDMAHLNQLIINGYSSRPFVTTFLHATNLLSGGFYLESFMLLYSCCEGMTNYWCEEIAKIRGIEKQYGEFSDTEISKCDACELYKKNPDFERPYKGMKPLFNDKLTFLFKHECITKEEKQRLTSYFYKVRHSNLRNDVDHYAKNDITKKEADESLDALLKLQDEFQIIINRLKVSQ